MKLGGEAYVVDSASKPVLSLLIGVAAGVSHFLYVTFSYFGVYERWAYFGGYPAPKIEYDTFLLGMVTAGIVGATISFQKGRYSQFGLVAVAFFAIIPGLGIAAIAASSVILINIVFASLTFLIAYTCANLGTWPRLDELGSPTLERLFVITALFSIPALLIVFQSFDTKIDSLGSIDIYGMRSEMRQESSSLLAGYAYGLTAKLTVISFAVFAILRRSAWLVVCALCFSIVVFSIGGHKSVLALTAMAMFVSLQSERLFGISGAKTLLLLALCVSLFFGLSLLMGNFLIHDVVIRRVVHVPGILIVHYLEFFHGVPNSLSHAALDNSEIPFIIGQEFFGRPMMRANASGYATSFAQLGFVGSAIFGAVYGLTIKAGNELVLSAQGKARSYLFSVLICYLWVLNESAIGAVYLTHGLGLFFVISFLSIIPFRRKAFA